MSNKKTSKPKLHIVAGPNGSGKTTFINTFSWNAHSINADVIEASLRINSYYICDFIDATTLDEQFQHVVHTLEAHNVPFGGIYDFIKVGDYVYCEVPSDYQDNLYSYLAASIATFLRYYAISNGINIVFETVFSTKEKLDFLQFANEEGYEVDFKYIYTMDPEINIARIAKRVSQGGHHVPDELVRSRYDKSMTLFQQVGPWVHSLEVYDNGFDFGSDHPRFHPNLVLRNKAQYWSVDLSRSFY